jgi:hypothetical protein
MDFLVVDTSSHPEVHAVGISSFLVTLGMMQLLRGVDMWLTNMSNSFQIFPPVSVDNCQCNGDMALP